MCVPAARSKVADWIRQVFSAKYYPLAGVEIFPKTPWGLNLTIPICVLPLPLEQSNIRRQGDKMRWFKERIRTCWLLPSPFFAEANQARGMIKNIRCGEQVNWLQKGWLFVKGYQNKADENKKSAVLTCNTEYPCGFQFASEDSRFRSSADSRTCLIGISVTCSPTCL